MMREGREMNIYIVAICGYEGIEDIFGFFNHDEALNLALELKSIGKRFHEALEKNPSTNLDYEKYEEDENYRSEENKVREKFYKIIEEKFGIYGSFKSEQICIMGNPSNNEHYPNIVFNPDLLDCACKEFPELPEQGPFYL